MGYDLGVDLGGTTVVAAVLRDGRAQAEVVPLGPDGALVMPATAHRGTDGVVRTGADAEHRAAGEPDRVVRDVTARLGDDVPLVVGDEPWRADDVAAELVLAAVRRVAAGEGGAARSLAVSRPSGWGDHRERTLRRALVRVGLGHATLVGESRAAVLAASTFGGLRAGRVAAVYDLGGRRFRAAVVRRGRRGIVISGAEGAAAAPGTTTTEVLADSGAPVRAGGTDVDAAVLAHVREELAEDLDTALAGLDDDAHRAALAGLRDAARAAKERLSADTEADVPVAVGPLSTTVRITRADLEARITPLVAATVDAFAGTLEAAGATPDQVVLVGGSSRIPLVARLLAEELGRPVRPELDPVTIVAQGAALAAAEHAASHRQDPVLPTTGPASGSFPTARPASGSFPTVAARLAAVAAGAEAPDASFAATAADVRERRRLDTGRRHPAAEHVEADAGRHAAGAAMAAAVAVGASAARSRSRAEPATGTVPAERDDTGWGPASTVSADTGETAEQPRRGSTALMERPRTIGDDDVPRPPIATGAAPIGELAPRGVFSRHRHWIVVVLVILALAAVAATVPIAGLTTSRTSTQTPAPTTTAPASAGPPPPAAAPPPPAASAPAPTSAPEPETSSGSSGGSSGSGSSEDTTTRRTAPSSTRASRTPAAQQLRPAPVAPAAAAPAAPAAPAPVSTPAELPAATSVPTEPVAQAPSAAPTAAETPIAAGTETPAATGTTAPSSGAS
ncbi:Hsp70 family protein [Actinomycetospora sp. OC33-EN08]|uniref:Hsp70 family protein n=1 Tax=Actinomycetospora aurantiaca TaxID=3129233 RepID=A0ABU8MH67_9PSEU